MLRSLSFSIFLFLVADSLYAQSPLPLPPRPSIENTQLKSLGTIFSGSPGTNPQINAEPPYQANQISNIPPPSPLRQASFASSPMSASVSASPEEPQSLYDDEYEDQNTYNPLLNKPLYSKRQTIEDTMGMEGGKSDTGGWTQQLAKPEFTPFISVGGSLLIVIAAFLLLAVMFRKVAPQGNRPLPKEAFECLGRYFVTQKHQLQVLRLGSRIVLVSIMPDGVSTLAEITDPDEAVSFLGLCRRLDTNSATEIFRKTVASMSEDELNRPHNRPVVTTRRQTGSLDLYSDPDESLASLLARGRR